MPDVRTVVLPSQGRDALTDSAARVGGPVFRSEEMSSADQSSMTGNGTWLHPLSSSGAGVSGLTIAAVQTAPFTADVGKIYPLRGVAIPDPPLPPTVYDITLPPAADHPNGSVGFLAVFPAYWDINASGSDTITLGNPYSIEAGAPSYVQLISDGVDTWIVRSLVI